MKTLVSIIILATSLPPLVATEQKPEKIPLKAPENWQGETIKLPPPFAPGMKIRGVEELRFAPGMFQEESDSFFSYVFVFRLEAEPKLTQPIVEKEFLIYFRGLASSVLKANNVEVDAEKFSLKLKGKEPGPQIENPLPQGVTAYRGELKWVEPFVTRKAQTLHLEIHTWLTSKHQYVFCAASPKEPPSIIWEQMHKIRKSFQETVGPESRY